MPVWGKVLHRDLTGTHERELLVRGTLSGILDCLETLQDPEAAAAE